MIYLDGCYIAKFYLAEPDSAAVVARITAEGAVGSALHAQVEVVAAFHRKMREGVMTGPELQLLVAQFDNDCLSGLWTWFPLDPVIIERCVHTIQTLPASAHLRTGDALHLACASHHRLSDVFSSDRHLLTAAPHFGLNGIKL
jgi:predicted nucleic acid-binding protein